MKSTNFLQSSPPSHLSYPPTTLLTSPQRGVGHCQYADPAQIVDTNVTYPPHEVL